MTLTSDKERLAHAIRAGNTGHLTIGEILQRRFENGDTDLTYLEAWLRNQGLTLPSPGTRTKYRTAYEAWVRNAGLKMGKPYYHPSFADDAGELIGMTLEGVSTYALYEARSLVTRGNAVEVLAACYTSTLDEIKDLASDVANGREGEGMRSLPRVPESVMTLFKDLEGEFPGRSRLEVLEFLIQFVRDLAEADRVQFRRTVAAYFGEEREDEDGE